MNENNPARENTERGAALLHKGHRERMRKKFLSEGMDNFAEHEKLEFLLFNTIHMKNTNDIAHRLMNEFGSLSGVFDAPIEKLTKVEGVGVNVAVFLKTVREMCRHYMIDKCSNDDKIINPSEAGDFFLPYFVARDNETIMLMLLDSKGKMLYCGVVSEGGPTSVDIYVRKIIELALQFNATKAIIAHNHPSGLALPSPQDIEATIRVLQSLRVIGVRLLDHVIVCDNDSVSMASSKLWSHIFKN